MKCLDCTWGRRGSSNLGFPFSLFDRHLHDHHWRTRASSCQVLKTLLVNIARGWLGLLWRLRVWQSWRLKASAADGGSVLLERIKPAELQIKEYASFNVSKHVYMCVWEPEREFIFITILLQVIIIYYCYRYVATELTNVIFLKSCWEETLNTQQEEEKLLVVSLWPRSE